MINNLFYKIKFNYDVIMLNKDVYVGLYWINKEVEDIS